MSYGKYETSIALIEAEKETAKVVGIENIEAFKEERVKAKAYGTTFVNLLGSYGNFEVDTNADGLADGWTNDAALSAVTNTIDTTYELFGSKAQKITLGADGEGGNYIEVTVAAAQALLVSGYIRAGDTSTTGKLIVDWRDIADAQISTDTVGTRAVASYARVSAVLTAPANTVKARIYATVAGVSGKLAYFDGIQIYNLTAQGALDPIRAAKYGVSNWSDLTEAQLEAEIPYFDSVMSVNIEDGTASELTIENRGKNLVRLDGTVNAIQSIGEQPRSIIANADIFPGFGNSAIVPAYAYDFKIENGGFYYQPHLDTYGVGVKIKVKPNTTYTWSIGNNENISALRVRYYTIDSLLINEVTSSNPESFTLTTPDKCAYMIFRQIAITSKIATRITDVRCEEGTSATDYVPPRTDSITIPDTCELHGYNGVFNHIDSNGNFTKHWERDDKTTDASGAFSLSGYASGSKVICRNKTNGEVKVLDAAASVTTSWTEEDVEILYQLETPVSTRLSRTLNLYPGQNNILSPDSKLPIALEFDYTVKGSSETMGFAQNFREVARTEHIEHRPMFLKTSKFYKKAEEYEISMDTVFFDTDLDESQLNGQEFFVEVLKDDETTELETLYSGCYLEAMSDTEDPVRKKGLRLVCQERIL